MCEASNLHTIKTIQDSHRTANIASDQKDHLKDDARAGSLLCRRINRAGGTGHSPNRRGRKRRNFLILRRIYAFPRKILLLLPRFQKFQIIFYRVKYYTVSSMLFNNVIKKMKMIVYVCILFQFLHLTYKKIHIFRAIEEFQYFLIKFLRLRFFY